MTHKYKSFIPHSGIELKTSKLVNSLFVWNYKTHLKWSGLEFVDFREYNFWDDVRKIDFLRSEQNGKTLIKLFEEERELGVYFLNNLDNISEEKRNILLNIIHLIGFWALKWWDKLWLCFASEDKWKFIPARKWKNHFINLVHNIDLFLEEKKTEKLWEDFQIIQYFNNLKVNKSLVFLLTDRFDIDEKQLKILALKNDLVVVHIFSHFENYLDGEWVIWLKKGFKNVFIDLDDLDKKNEYITLRKQKIKDFKKKVFQLWADYIYLDETKDAYKDIFSLMKKRS